MSTNIGNGYRLSPGISVTDFVRSLDVTFSDARRSVVLRAMGELIRQLDNSKTDKERIKTIEFATSNHIKKDDIRVTNRSNYSVAKDVLRKLQESLMQGIATRVPQLDCTFNVAFVSDPENSDDVYALIYTEQKEYVDVWESISGVEEYFYWNGSDSQLEDMTYKQWKARGAKWDKVVGNNPVSLNSVSWSLNTGLAIFSMDFSDEEIAGSVADSQLSSEAALAWAKRIWGDDLSGLIPGGIKDEDTSNDESEDKES